MPTQAQEALRTKHGTPEEFVVACYRAYRSGEINDDEFFAATRKYDDEWQQAGGDARARCRKCGSPDIHHRIYNAECRTCGHSWKTAFS